MAICSFFCRGTREGGRERERDRERGGGGGKMERERLGGYNTVLHMI